MRTRVPCMLAAALALAVSSESVHIYARGGGGGGRTAVVAAAGAVVEAVVAARRDPRVAEPHALLAAEASPGLPVVAGGVSRPSGGGGNASRPSGGGECFASLGWRRHHVPRNNPLAVPRVQAAVACHRLLRSVPSGGGIGHRSGVVLRIYPRLGPGTANRPSQQPAGPGGADRPGSGTANRPSQQPARPGGADRPGAGTADRPSQLPANPGAGNGVANRPGTQPGQRPATGARPSTGDVGNFLGIAGGAAAGGALGGALANRPSTLPAERPGAGNRPGAGERPVQPEQRPDWGERSQGRNEQWNQRVDNRNDAWNQRADNRTQARNDFQQNRDQRWNNLDSAREDRQNWRDQSRDDWQQHREDLWEYRGDRANEVWDNARDFYDDVFDDRWWGACGWGIGWAGNYPVNPWWWWVPATIGAVSTFVDVVTPDPIYIDYGMNVIYEGETVYVDNQPIPAAQYTQPMIDLAVNVEQPPPPLPPAPAQGRAPSRGQPRSGCRSVSSLSRKRREAIPSCSSSSR